MSQAQVGPGWWRASDGLWYPPDTHPAYLGPAAPPSSDRGPDPHRYPAGPDHPGGSQFWPGQQSWWQPVAAKTDGMAIASLVLSILWLAGVGSVLAVIFGAVALSRIKKSSGRLIGSGLATAGLVVGSIGILLTAGLGLVIPEIVSLGGPKTLSFGQAAVPSFDIDGIDSVTVQRFSEPISSNITLAGQPVQPGTGRVFAVATVRICADEDGSEDGVALVRSDLTLTRADLPPLAPSVDAMSPALDRVSTLSADACVTGFVTFEVPSGTRPAAVAWNAGPFQHTYNWTIASP